MTDLAETPQGETIPKGATVVSTYDKLRNFVMTEITGNRRNQSELAEISGLSQATISRAKKGVHDVTLNVYLTLATAIKRQDKLAMQEFEAEDAVSLSPAAPDIVAMAKEKDVVSKPKVGDAVWVRGVIDSIDKSDAPYDILLGLPDNKAVQECFPFTTDEFILSHEAFAPSDSAEVKRLKEQVEALTNEAVKMGKTIESLEFKCKQQSDAADLFLKQRDNLRKINELSGKAANS